MPSQPGILFNLSQKMLLLVHLQSVHKAVKFSDDAWIISINCDIWL